MKVDNMKQAIELLIDRKDMNYGSVAVFCDIDKATVYALATSHTTFARINLYASEEDLALWRDHPGTSFQIEPKYWSVLRKGGMFEFCEDSAGKWTARMRDGSSVPVTRVIGATRLIEGPQHIIDHDLKERRESFVLNLDADLVMEALKVMAVGGRVSFTLHGDGPVRIESLEGDGMLMVMMPLTASGVVGVCDEPGCGIPAHRRVYKRNGDFRDRCKEHSSESHVGSGQ